MNIYVPRDVAGRKVAEYSRESGLQQAVTEPGNTLTQLTKRTQVGVFNLLSGFFRTRSIPDECRIVAMLKGLLITHPFDGKKRPEFFLTQRLIVREYTHNTLRHGLRLQVQPVTRYIVTHHPQIRQRVPVRGEVPSERAAYPPHPFASVPHRRADRL